MHTLCAIIVFISNISLYYCVTNSEMSRLASANHKLFRGALYGKLPVVQEALLNKADLNAGKRTTYLI